jgi:hypothetical protein
MTLAVRSKKAAGSNSGNPINFFYDNRSKLEIGFRSWQGEVPVSSRLKKICPKNLKKNSETINISIYGTRN